MYANNKAINKPVPISIGIRGQARLAKTNASVNKAIVTVTIKCTKRSC